MTNNQSYLLLDCETGGLDCDKHPITQIALLAIDTVTFKEVNRFETFVKGYGGLTYDPIALKSTNITLADINKGITIEKLIPLFIAFCQNITPKGDRGRNFPIIVGHNVVFDLRFIKYAFNYCKKNLHESVNSNGREIVYIDTLPLSRAKWPNEGKHNLGACCERAGYKFADAHRAMADTVATKKLFEFLIGSLRGGKAENNEGTTATVKGKDSEFRKHFEM